MAAHTLPGFVDLLKETWSLFSRKFKSLLFLNLIAFGVGILAAIVIGALVAGTVAWNLVSSAIAGSINESTILPLIMTMLPQLVVVVVVLVVVMSLLSSLFMAAQVKALDEDKSVGELLSFGRSQMFRVFGLGVLVSLLATGGFWLLIVPGVIFAYLLDFSFFHLVNNPGGRLSASLKRSVAIVWANFWPLLGRMTLLFIIVAIVEGIFRGPSNSDHTGSNGLSWLVNTLMGWFSLVFTYVLYRHAEEATPKSAKVNFQWIVAPAIIGWILFGLTAGVGFKALEKSGAFDYIWQQINNSIEQNKEFQIPDTLTKN